MLALLNDSFFLAQPIPGQLDSTRLYFRIIAFDQHSQSLHDSTPVFEVLVMDPLPIAAPGDLIISELMINPSHVVDNYGEYIELFNASNKTLDLNQC